MTDQPAASARRRRGPSAGLPAASTPGLPAPYAPGADGQLAELEARLSRLEASSRLGDRTRDMVGRVIPPESTQHFRNAGREHLLGIRSIVDFWIRRIELAEDGAEAPQATRERIEVE